MSNIRVYLHGDTHNAREQDLIDTIFQTLHQNGYWVSRDASGTPELTSEQRAVTRRELIATSDVVVTLIADEKFLNFEHEINTLTLMNMGGNKVWIPLVESQMHGFTFPEGTFYESHGKAVNVVADEVLNLINKLYQRYQDVKKKERQFEQDKLERKVDDYVKPTIDELNSEKTLYRWLAGGCYFGGFLCLLLGVAFTFLTVQETAAIPQTEWIKLCVVGVKTAFTLALAFACSRYAFHIANSFMDEALRSAERIHAIRFGDLYLKVYGDKVEWEQIKEAFQNWNIDRKSPFGSMSADNYDPKLTDKMFELAKTAIDKGTGGKSD